MQTEFAEAYRGLARAAETNGIHLAIADYAMAINRGSTRSLRDFYGCTFGNVEWIIQANEAHSRLVREIARQYPFILPIDTQPALDGQYENFIDMIHFTTEAEHKMAETMFAALRDTLAQDLTPAPVSKLHQATRQ